MTNDAKQRLNTPRGKLPRASERARHVWAAHRDEDPSLDARGAALAPVIERFGATGSVLHNQEARATDARRERDEALSRLQRGIRNWMPTLRRDIAGFDTSEIPDSRVPEDAVACSRAIRDRVAGHLREGEPLAYAERLFATLVADEERVEAALHACYEADTLASAARAEHHAAALELDDELIAFRAVARRVLGIRHPDYRKLRRRAAHHDLEETLDDPLPETAAEPVEDPPQVPTRSTG